MYVYFASYGLLSYDFYGNELWKAPLPFKEIAFGNGTSPVVVDDKVILNLDDGGRWTKNADGKWEQFDVTAHILAVNRENGKKVWETPRQANARRYATPAIWHSAAGGQIVLFGKARLSGYDLATGKELWWIDGLPPQSCATPLIDGDRVYVTATGEYGEPETYVVLPAYEEFLKQHDKNGDSLVAVDEIPRELPLIDRRATGGTGNSPLFRFTRWLDPNQDKQITREEWEQFRSSSQEYVVQAPGLYSIRLGGQGDVSGTHIEWHQNRGVTEVPTPVIYEGRLYVVRNGGIVHCRDPRDGSQFFRGRLGSIGGYYASPVAGDGKIYFASDRGVITVIASGDTLEVLARNDLEERIMATPALVAGRIYVRTAAHLYAFGSKMETDEHP